MEDKGHRPVAARTRLPGRAAVRALSMRSTRQESRSRSCEVHAEVAADRVLPETESAGHKATPSNQRIP